MGKKTKTKPKEHHKQTNRKQGKKQSKTAKGKKPTFCVLIFHLNLHFTFSFWVCDLKLQFSTRGH